MTRNGSAFALATPAPATAATASSSSPPSPPPAPRSRLLPTPVAGAFNDGESPASWQARRDRQKKLGRNGNGIGTPLTIAIQMLPAPTASSHAAESAPAIGGQRPSGSKRQTALTDVITHHLGPLSQDSAAAAAGGQRLLPTPDTGTSPNGHGRRGGRPGNGHQSGKDLDTAARTLPAAGSAAAVAWGEYEPAIRRWEHALGHPAPPPAEPGPGGRPRLAAAFAEWMMGIPGLVTGVPGIPRTAQLKIIGNGVVPHQAAAALRLLAQVATAPGTTPSAGTSTRAVA
jgi:DNA (cytosine-5)-methyltransferase 1